jgi:replicative DNA helicase
MDIGAVVLHMLMEEQSLDGWARVKKDFFEESFNSLYTAMNKFYQEYNSIPSFEELETVTREIKTQKDLAAIQLLEVPEIELDLAIDALIDQYSQNESLKLLDDYVGRITLMDSLEVKEGLSGIVLKLDEKTHTDESVSNMSDLLLFQEEGVEEHSCIPLGINNDFDSKVGGAYREELIMIGGKRGSGKSLVSANMVANQYEMGNTAIYFTIEMTAMETFQRITSMLSGVSYANIRKNNLDSHEMVQLAKVRSDMFIDSEHIYEEFLARRDALSFERKLTSECTLKKDNQIIIVDDRSLSLTSIDLQLQKAKAQFGDKLSLVVVDYVNQIETGIGKDLYDWQSQIFASKKLKEFARKYDLAMVSPYQIDEGGGTRFAKGLLDSPDSAFLIEPHAKEDGAMTFTSTKVRSGPDIEFTSTMNWDTLKLGPTTKQKPSGQSDEEVSVKNIGKKQKTPKKEGSDMPW